MAKMSCADGEIDDLLDSALEDFDNLPKPMKKKNVSEKCHVAPEDPITQQKAEEEFLKIFQNVGIDSGSGPVDIQGLKQELDKLAEATDQRSPLLADTLSQINKSTSGLATNPSEEELAAMLSNFGGGNKEPFDNLMPMMEGMMQSLLSKELLYPALKDIAEKFPDWLADNRCKISEAEYNKFNKQYDLTKRICFAFEEEKEEDSESVKKERFDTVMSLMQEMQSLGQPPKELTGDAGPPAFQFDAEGNPILPDMMGDQQCVIS